jgi:type II secretory pathway pseudopilin PulG
MLERWEGFPINIKNIMDKKNIKNSSSGFGLLEAILAISLLSLVASVFAGALIYGQQSAFSAGNFSRAIFVAQEGLEAVRNIRDEDFSNLEDGIRGLAIQDGVWRLTNDPDTVDIFSREIEISTIDANTKKVVATVSWTGMFQPSQTTLTTYFINQQTPTP